MLAWGLRSGCMRFLLPVMFCLALPGLALAESPGRLCRAAITAAETEARIPAGLLHAIGRVESGRRDPETGEFAPWPWVLNAEGQGRFFPDQAAAIAAVRELQARGVRVIDVGCMQINLHHHPRAFANLEEAFDPMSNARYAARFLTQLNDSRNDWAVSAGHYHSQTPHLAEAYRARVMAAWPQEQARLGREPPAVAAAPRPAGPVLANNPEAARIIPLDGARGRGLDAYRAAPVPITGRAVAPMLVAQPTPGAPPPMATPAPGGGGPGVAPLFAGRGGPLFTGGAGPRPLLGGLPGRM